MTLGGVQKVGASFTSLDAQSIYNQIGLSAKYYDMIYKQMNVGFSKVFTRKRILPLPKPLCVRQACKHLNTKVLEQIDKPCHIAYNHVHYVPIIEAPIQNPKCNSTFKQYIKQSSARGKRRTTYQGKIQQALQMIDQEHHQIKVLLD